jgi:hypothetical protein
LRRAGAELDAVLEVLRVLHGQITTGAIELTLDEELSPIRSAVGGRIPAGTGQHGSRSDHSAKEAEHADDQRFEGHLECTEEMVKERGSEAEFIFVRGGAEVESQVRRRDDQIL